MRFKLGKLAGVLFTIWLFSHTLPAHSQTGVYAGVDFMQTYQHDEYAHTSLLGVVGLGIGLNDYNSIVVELGLSEEDRRGREDEEGRPLSYQGIFFAASLKYKLVLPLFKGVSPYTAVGYSHFNIMEPDCENDDVYIAYHYNDHYACMGEVRDVQGGTLEAGINFAMDGRGYNVFSLGYARFEGERQIRTNSIRLGFSMQMKMY